MSRYLTLREAKKRPSPTANIKVIKINTGISKIRIKRQNQTRKVNSSNNILIAHQRTTGLGQGSRKKLPKQKSRINKNRIGNSVGRNFSKIAKENTKDNHCDKGLE